MFQVEEFFRKKSPLINEPLYERNARRKHFTAALRYTMGNRVPVWARAAIVSLPAFWIGCALRLEAFHTAVHTRPSAEAFGFVALAESGLHWYYGWREPLFPQLIWLTARVAHTTELRALSIVATVASIVALPLVFAFAVRAAGPVAGVVATYLLAPSRLHLDMLAYRERADVYLVLLVAIWLALWERRWITAGAVTALATWLRLTTLANVALTIALWFAFSRSWRHWPGARLVLVRHRRELTAAGIAAVLALPLFLYYRVKFGAFDYLPRQIYYDYFVAETQDHWLADVTGGFERHYDPPAGFDIGAWLGLGPGLLAELWLGLKRTLLPAAWTVTLGALVPIEGLAIPFYYVGAIVAAVRARFILACLLGYTLPLLTLAWSRLIAERFFVPTLTLAYILIGLAAAETLRWISERAADA